MGEHKGLLIALAAVAAYLLLRSPTSATSTTTAAGGTGVAGAAQNFIGSVAQLVAPGSAYNGAYGNPNSGAAYAGGPILQPGSAGDPYGGTGADNTSASNLGGDPYGGTGEDDTSAGNVVG